MQKTFLINKKSLVSILEKLPITSQLINRRRKNFELQSALKRLRRKTPVFIYQMGKVASTSIYTSIKQHYDGEVLHGHTFEKKHYKLGIRALFHLYRKDRNAPIKLITLVREPIGRNVSSLFQNFKRTTGVEFTDHNFSLEEIKEIFLNRFPHEVPLTWFDQNIKNHFNIDVYDYPFPKEGFLKLHKNNIQLLIMKHDLDDSIKENLIKDFLSLEQFSIINENVGSKKVYSETYKSFKKLTFPLWYFEKMSNSKFMNHFYSKEEIQKVYEKWNFE